MAAFVQYATFDKKNYPNTLQSINSVPTYNA